MATRVEQDRHFHCEPGVCRAPMPRKLAAGRNAGACVPRKTWWLRTLNSAGKRVSIGFRSEPEAREAARKVEAARILGQDYRPRTAVTAPEIEPAHGFSLPADLRRPVYSWRRGQQVLYVGQSNRGFGPPLLSQPSRAGWTDSARRPYRHLESS
jgi:hypothetical protein